MSLVVHNFGLTHHARSDVCSAYSCYSHVSGKRFLSPAYEFARRQYFLMKHQGMSEPKAYEETQKSFHNFQQFDREVPLPDLFDFVLFCFVCLSLPHPSLLFIKSIIRLI